MQVLAKLGSNLRSSRKSSYPDDDLAAFAVRIGVSRATLQKMEKGDLSVGIGRYYQAAQVLGLEACFEQLLLQLPQAESLFND